MFSYSPDKNCGANIVKSLGSKGLPTSHVPVLMVYSAENSVFQQAVVALAEFLQCHGGCRVAVDMWQQQKIAKLGPMRWLVEQVKAADRVLIVCPQVAIVSISDFSHGYFYVLLVRRCHIVTGSFVFIIQFYY